jgi:hypothetical protein
MIVIEVATEQSASVTATCGADLGSLMGYLRSVSPPTTMTIVVAAHHDREINGSAHR